MAQAGRRCDAARGVDFGDKARSARWAASTESIKMAAVHQDRRHFFGMGSRWATR